MNTPNWPTLTPETQEIWEKNARFWDDYMGAAGNDFHQSLIKPSTEALLNVQPDELVLDIGCGNGNFSRRLTELGARVVAIDFSPTFIARAQAHHAEQADRITYQVVDATNKPQLLALGQGETGPKRLDAAVANMALMDMATIEPLLEALSHLLKPQGRFVFSIIHPCFQSPKMTKVVEEDDCEGDLVTRYAVKISEYITPTPFKGLGIIGQPEPHYYFHRPLSLIFKQCFQAGFILDGLEEPTFKQAHPHKRPASWRNYQEIPPAIILRLRLGF